MSFLSEIAFREEIEIAQFVFGKELQGNRDCIFSDWSSIPADFEIDFWRFGFFIQRNVPRNTVEFHFEG